MTTLDEFFAGKPLPQALFGLVLSAVETVGPASLRITKSQIAFRRRRGFAWAWMPGQYLRGPAAPLVLSLALPWRDSSPRWKEIVEPAPGRFMHHLELSGPGDIDSEVSAWIQAAWDAAE
jgi:hypothetical protein